MARMSRRRIAMKIRISNGGQHSGKYSDSRKHSSRSKHSESQVETSKNLAPRSKFQRLLTKLHAQLAGRFHTGSDKLEVAYEVLDDVVGSGCTGDVLLARSRTDEDDLFAVKTYDLGKMSTSDMESLEVELTVLLLSDHHNVLQATAVYESENSLRIVTPYMAGGNLTSARLSELQVARAAQQMVSGVQDLHRLGYMHRDIKPANFVLDSDDDVKLIDFGLCATWKPHERPLYTQCGTDGFLSPELSRGEGYTNKTDMWSLGVTIFYLLMGSLPFAREDDSVPSQRDVDTRIESCTNLGSVAQHFLSHLLKVDPGARPTAEQASLHPWFSSNSVYADETSSALKQWEQSLLKSQKKVSGARWVDLDSDDDDDEAGACEPWGRSLVKCTKAAPRWVDIMSDDD